MAADPHKCAGNRVTISGTPGDDRLRGTARTDVIDARGGDDRISGLGGFDLICGGGGSDTIRGGNRSDALLGGPGDDLLREGKGTGDGSDIAVFGPNLAFYLFVSGNGGDDRLFGGRGSDALGGIGR
jgi:Ca2+-binding RTX toxin-like protein